MNKTKDEEGERQLKLYKVFDNTKLLILLSLPWCLLFVFVILLK